jgi:hypothetical protein
VLSIFNVRSLMRSDTRVSERSKGIEVAPFGLVGSGAGSFTLGFDVEVVNNDCGTVDRLHRETSDAGCVCRNCASVGFCGATYEVVPAPPFEGGRSFAAKKKQIQQKKMKLTKFLHEMDGRLLPKDAQAAPECQGNHCRHIEWRDQCHVPRCSRRKSSRVEQPEYALVKNQRRSKTGDECFQVDHVRLNTPKAESSRVASHSRQPPCG